MLVNLINSSDFESFMLAAYSVALVRWVGGWGGEVVYRGNGRDIIPQEWKFNFEVDKLKDMP